MDRITLQRLAKSRLEEARALLDAGHWDGAYYLAGYVIECGLKAALLRYLSESTVVFGDESYVRNKLTKCWTHNLAVLMDYAGLTAQFKQETDANINLSGYWGVAKDRSEVARYQEKTEAQAKELFEAVRNIPDGVFQWIQSRW